MKGDKLGEFEELMLLAVLALDPPVYGVPLQQYLEQAGQRSVAMGAVYSALDRLEAKGLVRSVLGEATAQRGGKAKRLYTATPAGVRVVRDVRRVRDRLWRAIEDHQ
ncbi:MAG TPA: PadR family transcriptional regulator [Vicinamibacterales bacterium]